MNALKVFAYDILPLRNDLTRLDNWLETSKLVGSRNGADELDNLLATAMSSILFEHGIFNTDKAKSLTPQLFRPFLLFVEDSMLKNGLDRNFFRSLRAQHPELVSLPCTVRVERTSLFLIFN